MLSVALGWPLTSTAAPGPAAAAEGPAEKQAEDPAAQVEGPAAQVKGPAAAAEDPAAQAEGPTPKTTTVEPSARDEVERPATASEPADPPANPGSGPETPPKVELTPEELERRMIDMRPEQAESHWQEGQRLYYNGRYAEAAVEFERAYGAIPAAAALYSAALSYERAGKAVEAVRALERYLALPDCSEVPPEQQGYCTAERPLATQALAEQRRRVGELTLDLGEGVELREVRVAGRTVPLDDFPLLLLPGTVDVEVFGLGPAERRSRPAYITAGETYELYVAPFETAGVVPPPGGALRPGTDGERDELRLAQRKRQLKASFWVGTGLTVTAGVAAAVTGGIASYHQRRYNTEKCPVECWEKDPDGNPSRDEDGNVIYLNRPYPLDHQQAQERYRPLANAMLGVTIGLGVATALVGVFAFRKRKDAPATGRERARAHVRLGGSGLVVRW